MNSKEELMPNDFEIIKEINHSLELLKYGKFEEALDTFSTIQKIQYSNSIADSGIKYCKYWITRKNKINSTIEDYKKAKMLFDEWRSFEKFARLSEIFKKK